MTEQCGERIAELQEVEKKVADLLSASGLAIQSLTPGGSIQTRKEEFQEHAETFARLLEEVTVTLRRNIIALSKTATVAGEHSSMTLMTREKEVETWDNIREILKQL